MHSLEMHILVWMPISLCTLRVAPISGPDLLVCSIIQEYEFQWLGDENWEPTGELVSISTLKP